MKRITQTDDYYGTSVFWMEGVVRSQRPKLVGRVDADVVILGGGFTGLWTAYHLASADPSAKIVIVEGHEVGFGASGRNGGFAMTLLDISLAHLLEHQGLNAARAAHDAMVDSVNDIGATIQKEGIDCDWVHGGLMVVATNDGQLHRLHRDLRAAEKMGLDHFEELDTAAVRAEVDSATYIGGLFDTHCATVQPAKLARGLADAVERRGVTIFEMSPVHSISDAGTRSRLLTEHGEIVADQIVLATNAWARNLPWFSNKVVPLYTYVLVTEPLTTEQWDSVGWERRQGIEDKRNFVHYYRQTADGRILWGGRDGIVHAHRSRRPAIGADFDRSRVVARRLAGTFRQTFPQLDQVRFTHHWGGPIGMTATFLPQVGTLVEGRVHYGHGYNGHGVAPTHAVGRILADRVLRKAGPLDELCFVDATEPRFPPEPFAWLGAELSRQSLLREDRLLEEGRSKGEVDQLLLRLIRRLR